MSLRLLLVAVASVSCSVHLWSDPIGEYGQTNLVSNISGLAAQTDPNLVNPWGISSSATSSSSHLDYRVKTFELDSCIRCCELPIDGLARCIASLLPGFDLA